MKKTIWTFGLIAGAILSIMMVATIPFVDSLGYEKGAVIGYTTMVLAFLLVYFGIRSYRDNVGGGSISFGRAVAVGMLIVAVASVCYTATWQVIYRTYYPDFMDKYMAHQLDKARADGKSEAELAQMKVELDKDAKLYSNPIVNVAVNLLEPLPVGVLVTLISAMMLRRKRRPGDPVLATA